MRRKLLPTVAAVLIASVLGALHIIRIPVSDRAFCPFAPDRSCAISVTDDTDFFQMETGTPVYALLDSLGLRVTKTVWAFDGQSWSEPEKKGLSLENPEYRAWVLAEAERGHEIGLHSASSDHDDRETILAAHGLVEDLFATEPRIEAFHATNREGLYWGTKRAPNQVLRFLYRLVYRAEFEGEVEGSPHYWVDVSRSLIPYVRSYTIGHINTLAVNPSMPYEDSRTPGAPLWFANSNGRLAAQFVALLSPPNVELLKRQNGVCIIYTHLGANFVRTGPQGRPEIKEEAREVIVRCGTDPAVEFVPTGEILDRLRLIQCVEDFLRAADAGSVVYAEDVYALGYVETAPGRRSELVVPSELLASIDDISVDPAKLVGHYSVPTEPGVERLSLASWAAACGLDIRGGDVGVFDGARQLGWRERWRVTLRWLMTHAG